MAVVQPIQILGTDEAKKFLDNVEASVVSNVVNFIRDATLHVEGEVKLSIAGQRAEQRSVDTGRFLNSVSSSSDGFGGVVFSNVEYAEHLEKGTSSMQPRSHFGNTAARETPKLRSKIAGIIGKSIK